MTDPRQHRHAIAVDDDQIIYSCGCINAIDPLYGVLRNELKCRNHQRHQRAPESLGLAYYTELGVFADGIPQCMVHMSELLEAMGPIPAPPVDPGLALEIGSGPSLYCSALLRRGYRYSAIEPSEWAAKWLTATYGVNVLVDRFEAIPPAPHFHFVLAAHSLEHMPDAPAAIRRCADWLQPEGHLWIVIPDDSDPLNADHLWFFNETTLETCIEAAGLIVTHMAVRQHVKHEQFIYARARKPL